MTFHLTITDANIFECHLFSLLCWSSIVGDWHGWRVDKVSMNSSSVLKVEMCFNSHIHKQNGVWRCAISTEILTLLILKFTFYKETPKQNKPWHERIFFSPGQFKVKFFFTIANEIGYFWKEFKFVHSSFILYKWSKL